MSDPLLRVCPVCARYTFRADCPEGHGPTRTPHPARFDPADRYGKYRRRLQDAARGRPSAA
ncbi:Nucleolar RNA-binding protein Nop10p [mine drainage metagenome]|uniref:Ribosome biogenesis protein Nop10 n=1 Tax=mine drainage metagenome TaxID=410659 RepID=T0XYE8_9ZZZZ